MGTVDFDNIRRQIKDFKLSIKYSRQAGNVKEVFRQKDNMTHYLKGLEDAGIKEEELDSLIEEVDEEIKKL